MWENCKYSDVLPLLLKYREGPYGRKAEVDYMIATSACRLPNVREEGYDFFRWILSYYSLDKKSRTLVVDEMQKCAPHNAPRAIAFSDVRAEVGVRGKMYFGPEAEKAAITSDPVEVVRNIPIEELTGRLFQASDREAAVRKVQALAGSKFLVQSFGPFVWASSSGHSSQDLEDIARDLEKVLLFLGFEFEMDTPPHLITLYLVPDTNDCKRIAQDLHGIRIPSVCIGYSFRDDLSIVAVIPQMRYGYGTLCHELFHLMVRSNFGDIPPWMDEGMAALYEESRISGDSVIGLPNWRGPVLKRFWLDRPSIEDLVKADWQSLVLEKDWEEKKQAANLSMARYFILYLQEKQKLVEVYKAFRTRKVQDTNKDPGQDAVQLLESLFQEPIAKMDEDFGQWFNEVPDPRKDSGQSTILREPTSVGPVQR
jgi:hypothetical protein